MTFEVFTPLTCRGRLRKPKQYSLSLSLLYRVSFTPEPPLQLQAVASLPQQKHLPCGFFPFDVFPVSGSNSTWKQPTSSLLPSQRFSRSQGLNPPGTCRPYFMPVPSMGFLPSRVHPTRGAVRPFERRCPPVVCPAPGFRVNPLLFQTTQAVTL